MKTDDLILGLSAVPPEPPLRPAMMGVAIGVAIGVPVVVFLGLLGFRHDLVAAWGNPVVPVQDPAAACDLRLVRHAVAAPDPA